MSHRVGGGVQIGLGPARVRCRRLGNLARPRRARARRSDRAGRVGAAGGPLVEPNSSGNGAKRRAFTRLWPLVDPFAGTPDDPQRATRGDEAGHVPVVPSNPDHRARNVGHDSGPWLSSHLLGLDRDAITHLDQGDPRPAGTARSTPTCTRRGLLHGSALGRLARRGLLCSHAQHIPEADDGRRLYQPPGGTSLDCTVDQARSSRHPRKKRPGFGFVGSDALRYGVRRVCKR
jgi:hypothetical protein